VETAAILVSFASLCVAAVAAWNAVRSRRAAEVSRDQAIAANHRADTPLITAHCDGKYGNSFGLTVEFTSSRDLDEMHILLTESWTNGTSRGGFQDLWADRVRNMPTRVEVVSGEAHFADVEAARTCSVVATSLLKSIPKTARLSFRVKCRDGGREWAVPVTTGEVAISFTTSP